MFNIERCTLLNIINETDSAILDISESFLTRVLLYGLYGNESFKVERDKLARMR